MERFRVYLNNNVESNQVAAFDDLQQAISFCDDELKGLEPIHPEDTDEWQHRAIAKHYEVFDGDPVILDEDGDAVDFADPVYETKDYYID